MAVVVVMGERYLIWDLVAWPELPSLGGVIIAPGATPVALSTSPPLNALTRDKTHFLLGGYRVTLMAACLNTD
jgi:hypothetical protein